MSRAYPEPLRQMTGKMITRCLDEQSLQEKGSKDKTVVTGLADEPRDADTPIGGPAKS